MRSPESYEEVRDEGGNSQGEERMGGFGKPRGESSTETETERARPPLVFGVSPMKRRRPQSPLPRPVALV